MPRTIQEYELKIAKLESEK